MRFLCLLGSLLLLALPAQAADPPTIGLMEIPGKGRVVEVQVAKEVASRLKATPPTAKEWNTILRLVVAGGTADEMAKRPPVAGTYRVEADAIRFEPQFAIVPGLKYQATFAPARLPGGSPEATAVTTILEAPKLPPGPPTTIAAVYPSANRLPENTLRLYVHFSGQMTRGEIYRHLKLIRDDGKEVNRPFLEIDEELWSVDGLRITLLFHPGRVKRGLEPREEEGPILEEGRRYTLVIDQNWKDAEGRPLVATHRKTFSVGPPDDEPVNPDQWTMIPPRARSDSPLILRLAKPLDRALLGSTVWVTDATGQRVAGEATVGGGERVVTFAPAQPWKAGTYRLVVDSRLEDVCGNRVGEPFEVELLRPADRKIDTKPTERPFVVR
jgi:hypothetical protein